MGAAEINVPITDLKSIPFERLWRTAAGARITLAGSATTFHV